MKKEFILNGEEMTHSLLSTYQLPYIIISLLLICLLLVYIIQLKQKIKERDFALQIKHRDCSSLHTTLGLMAEKIEVQFFMYDEVNRKHYKYANNQFIPSSFSLEESEKLIHPEDIEQYKQDYSNIITGATDECISRVRIYNNEQKAYENFKNVVRPIKKSNGKVTHYVYIQQNETEYKHLIHKQKELIESLYMALKSAKIVRWVRDEEKKIITFTDSNTNETIFSFNDMKNLFQREEEYAQFEEFIKNLSSEETNSIILPLRLTENENHKLQEICALAVKNKKGETVSTYGIARDLTETLEYQNKLKEKIQLLETIEECMPVGISIYNKEGKLQSSNEEAARALGIDRIKAKSEAISLFQGTDPLTPTIFSLQAGESIQMNATYHELTEYIKPWIVPEKPHGEYFDIRCTPIVSEQGEIQGYLSICIDLTEELKNQETLRSAKEKAEASEKLKMNFLANISHEIRTPLNAIIGFSDLLQTTENPEEKATFVEIIKNNNALLLGLISDILDLSKIESGTLDLTPKRFDLCIAIEEVYNQFKSTCQNQQLELLLHNPYQECLVTLDEERCLQILSNFLHNALKFTPKGHIRMGCEYRENGIVLFTEDSGIGIPAEKKDLLFKHFAKLDEFSQGAGLGLTICKAIAQAMGGKVGVKSNEGEGSIFWAWIPCEAAIKES
ncbi:MAG: ATP-binding protein [Phocaeicola sp.]